MQFDEILNKAYQQTYQGDYDLALYLLSDLNSKHPNNPDVLSLLADVNILNKHSEAAETYIDQARELSPDSPQVHRVLSRLFLSKNQIDQALESASKAVRGDKTSGANYIALAAVHCKQGNFDKAENFLNIALDLDPKNPEASYYKAVIANQTQQYASSIRILKKVLDEYPSLDKCWFLLAQTYKETNRSKLALEAIDKAIKINPDNADYHLLKAEMLPDLNRKEEAVELLTEYTARFEPDVRYYTVMGLVYFKLAKYEESLKYLDQAIDINPEHETAYKHKARLLTTIDELEQAVACYKQLLELTPNDAAVIAEIGSLYSSMGQNEEAVFFLDKALQVNSGIPLPYLKKGLTGKAPEDVAKAERNAAKAANFGLIYGQGVKSFRIKSRNSYHVNFSEAKATRIRTTFLEHYQTLHKWQQNQRIIAQSRRVIDSVSGRQWRIPYDRWYTTSLNYPIQGAGAEILYAALARLDKYLDGLDACLVNVVHDELIVEAADSDAPAAQAALERAMTEGFLEVFPEASTKDLVEAKIGKSWAEAK